jgi:hypothetical protein
MLLGDRLNQPRCTGNALAGKEAPTMSGSSQAVIFIPIVVMAVLAVWLILVFYADSHPGWGVHRSPPELTGTASRGAIAASEPPQVTAAADGAPMPGTPAPG